MVALSQIEVAMKPTTLVTLLLSLLLTSSLTAQSRGECSDRPSNESYSACQDRLHPESNEIERGKADRAIGGPIAHHAPVPPCQRRARLRYGYNQKLPAPNAISLRTRSKKPRTTLCGQKSRVLHPEPAGRKRDTEPMWPSSGRQLSPRRPRRRPKPTPNCASSVVERRYA